MQLPPETSPRTQTTACDANRIAIRVRGLSKWYGSFRVLHDVDLQVAASEKVVLCGPSGSGKSTLIRCLNGLETFDRGELHVDGRELTPGARTGCVRESVGMVFQQFNLFPHLTVLENLVLAPLWVRRMPRREAEALALRYLEKVRLPGEQDKYPAQLSGGQQQRVAIARALCMQPRVMLFDEPTSALDPEMVGEVLDTMLQMAGSGMTLVCVTHELGFARRFADRMVFMDAGAIVEDRPTQQFFEQPDATRLRQFLAQVR